MARAMTSLGNKKHLERFILNRGGKTIEEIALAENISEEAVRKSIRSVEVAKGYHTQEYLTESLIGIILKSTPAAQEAILTMLTATKPKTVTNERGETATIFEPDTDVIAKGLSEYRQLAAVAQPKPGHSTNVKVGVGLAMGQANGSFVGMEERMREIRQQRKDQPVLSAPVIQATVLSGDDVHVEDGDEEE